jgi:glycerophosphoryl diester phosphodiesterase
LSFRDQEMNHNFIQNQIKYLPASLASAPKWKAGWKMPQLQAHRGCWLKSNRQNSLASLMEAKNQSFLMAEFDVQLTKDGIPILFHDFDLIGELGINVQISELNYNDLKRLISLPTLLEVLSTKNRPDFLNIEIKSRLIKSALIEEKILEVINKTKTQDQILFSSFNPWSLARLKKVLPMIPRAMLVTNEPENWNHFFLKKMWLLPLVNPHLIHFNFLMLDQQLVSFFKNKDFKISAWTVNSKDKAQELLNWGVDSLITDALLPRMF